MTRVLQYTDGSTVGSVSDVSLGFGTSIARVTTRAALYDAIVTLLAAAGMSQHNQATRDDVWTSTGESALESINIRTRYDGSTKIYFYVGTKVDGSSVLQGSIGGGANNYEFWSLAADATFDILALATKDFFWIIVKRASDNIMFAAFCGNMERDQIANPNVLVSAASASSGSYVTIDTTGTNPVTMNYIPGDLVQIVSGAAADAAQAQTVQITNVTTTSIEVASLAATYAAGARIGALPCPIARFVGSGIDPDSTANWYGPLLTSIYGATSDLASAPGQVFNVVDFAAGSTNTAQDGFGTATTPNKRTKRFTLRAMLLKSSLDEVLGRIPGMYVYPGTNNYYPNDTGTWNRITPSQRFISTKFTNAPTKHWMLGKAP